MFGKLTFIAFLGLLLRLTTSTQFTFDQCCQDSDCASGRSCTFVELEQEFKAGPCVPGRKDCLCSQGDEGVQNCLVDLECLEGDVCDRGAQVCLSSCFLASQGSLELNEEQKAVCDIQPEFPETCPVENPSSADLPENSGGNGSIGDPCSITSDCEPPFKCLSLDIQSKECETGEECQCNRKIGPTPSVISQPLPEPEDELIEETDMPTVTDEFGFPASSNEAGEPIPSGEVEIFLAEEQPTPAFEPEVVVDVPAPQNEIATATATPTTETTGATLEEIEESPEPTEAVCVAVEELEGVQKVFERDYHAWVLCDTTGSCATPGHMVLWNGIGMMMKSYCDIVGCERKVMVVNSPRWSAGAIRAKTNGLSYTSFAARWESRAEEQVLAAVVRLAI